MTGLFTGTEEDRITTILEEERTTTREEEPTTTQEEDSTMTGEEATIAPEDVLEIITRKQI